jgi:DMSO/TMAO reductase YedYZ molybdopterin-dependent catalytic subunit
MKRLALPALCLLLIVTQLVLGACTPAPAPAAAPAAPTTAPTLPTATEPPPTPVPPSPTAVPPTEAPTATAIPPTATPEPQPVLEVVGPSGSKFLTLDDLQKLAVVEGEAGQKSSTGKITPPLPHKGVTLLTLAELLGPLQEGQGVNAVAKDGYAITFSYDQLKNGTFIAYDPATGDELKTPPQLNAILAFERDGKPLPADSDGTLRVAIISPKNNQVTDGHWSVKWVNKIEVKDLVADWELALNGAIQARLDRATFESCVGCHKATWTDDKAQVWTGVPLWYLMGYADDETKHGDAASYNEALAKAGYKVEPVAADGFKATLDSVALNRNNDVIVASLVDNNALPEKYFPLRLVGSPLKKNEMVGAIAEIDLDVAAAPAAEPAAGPTVAPTVAPTAAPAAPAAEVKGDLVVIGAVEKELGLTEADLRGMDVVKITAEHPKKGTENYEGVRFSELFALTKPAAAAKTIVFTAVDGFTAETALSDITSCADCLVAFTNTPGKLKLVLPKLASNLWVKDITTIELK